MLQLDPLVPFLEGLKPIRTSLVADAQLDTRLANLRPIRTQIQTQRPTETTEAPTTQMYPRVTGGVKKVPKVPRKVPKVPKVTRKVTRKVPAKKRND